MPLTPAISSYLDLIRFLASFAVVLGHSNMAGNGTGGAFIGQYGHTSVIVFFILSGYIICRTTIDSNRNFKYYAIVRISRIYTVAIPAIILSILISIALKNNISNIESLDPTFREISSKDILSSIFFTNQSWLIESQLSLNAPYWSLCYEFWYYLIFSCIFFIKKMQLKILFVASTLIIAGPGIIILFPIWLMGAALAKYKIKFEISKKMWGFL